MGFNEILDGFEWDFIGVSNDFLNVATIAGKSLDLIEVHSWENDA